MTQNSGSVFSAECDSATQTLISFAYRSPQASKETVELR